MQIDFSLYEKEICLLEKELERTKFENAILRESNCTCDSSYKDKLKAIKKLYGKYPIRVLCRALDVGRSNYYHYKLRSLEKTQIEINNEIYKSVIKRIFEETKGRLGARKILALMREEGYFTS